MCSICYILVSYVCPTTSSCAIATKQCAMLSIPFHAPFTMYLFYYLLCPCIYTTPLPVLLLYFCNWHLCTCHFDNDLTLFNDNKSLKVFYKSIQRVVHFCKCIQITSEDVPWWHCSAVAVWTKLINWGLPIFSLPFVLIDN